ncbi:MAG: hypothetical protein JJU19_07790 [Pararhodobacter sp.]|nr:hypothetical protein [Pararhodobacter sp.]
MDRKQKQALNRLRALAALKRDAEMAQLSALARTRARLQAAVDALDQHRPVLGGACDWRMADRAAAAQPAAKRAAPVHGDAHGQDTTPPAAPVPAQTARADAGITDSPALIKARLQHRRWVEIQRSLLNQRLAQVTADWLTRRPAAIRAFGRVSVLDRLASQAKEQRAGTQQDT